MTAIALNGFGVLPAQRPCFFEFLADLLVGIYLAVTHPGAVRTLMADTVVDLLDAGAGPGVILMQTSGAVEVATLTFSDPAFGNADGTGLATANAITSDTSATGGTMAQFEARDSNAVAVFLGNVQVSGGDINMSSLGVAANDEVALTNLTYQAAA